MLSERDDCCCCRCCLIYTLLIKESDESLNPLSLPPRRSTWGWLGAWEDILQLIGFIADHQRSLNEWWMREYFFKWSNIWMTWVSRFTFNVMVYPSCSLTTICVVGLLGLHYIIINYVLGLCFHQHSLNFKFLSFGVVVVVVALAEVLRGWLPVPSKPHNWEVEEVCTCQMFCHPIPRRVPLGTYFVAPWGRVYNDFCVWCIYPDLRSAINYLFWGWL